MGWQVHGSDLSEWDGPPPDRAYAQPGDKELAKRGRPSHRASPASACWCWWPTAIRSRSLTASRWRCCTAAGVRSRAGSSRRPWSRFAGARRRGRSGYRWVLLRGRPGGAGGTSSGVEGAATGRMLDLRGRDLRLKLRGGRRLAMWSTSTAAPAAPRTSTSPTAATTASPAARRASSCAMDPERVRRNLERVRERIGAEVEILAADEVRRGRRPARPCRGGHRRWWARTARRTAGEAGGARRPVHLGLHRRAPEPQGQGRAAARPADPLARVATRRCQARAAPGQGGPGPGQRGGRGREGRGRPRTSSPTSSSAAPARDRPDDDAAVRRGARGQPPPLRPRWPSWPASTGSSASRWARRRTTRSPPRRARRSCASGSVLYD